LFKLELINKKISKICFHNKISLLILLTVIVLLSLFPRSIEALNGNPIFGFDQGREMIAARNIVVNHKLILIGTEVGAGMAGRY